MSRTNTIATSVLAGKVSILEFRMERANSLRYFTKSEPLKLPSVVSLYWSMKFLSSDFRMLQTAVIFMLFMSLGGYLACSAMFFLSDILHPWVIAAVFVAGAVLGAVSCCWLSFLFADAGLTVGTAQAQVLPFVNRRDK